MWLMIGVAIGLVLVVWAVQWVVMHAELAEHSLRSGGGRVDATGEWLVGAKGEYPLHRPFSLATATLLGPPHHRPAHPAHRTRRGHRRLLGRIRRPVRGAAPALLFP